MEDILENFIKENALTMENVRSLVDDYSLFSYYIGAELDVQVKYSSPLRKGDNDPSFTLYYGYGEFSRDKLYFKDHMLNVSGDVFDFLMLLFNTNSLEKVLRQVDFDLGLNLGTGEKCDLVPTIIKEAPTVKERPKLKIVSQADTKGYINYWEGNYEIGKRVRNLYHASCLSAVHYEYSHKTTIVVPKNLCIGYTIGKYYKTYQPFESKEYKFRNDFPSNYIEGHMQIDWSRNDLLVISKAFKEDMLFRQHWDIQAVSGKSETTFIHPKFMAMYLKHFKRVVVWLDPDEAGTRSSKKYKELYPKLEIVEVPSWINEKDPTDFYEVHRNLETTAFVKSMLQL
ncbi:hypothetical protein [Tenacibaculum sp.]|uniref:hypothetical protein n=1 Tax=Tenacibaculum sp. TaxID=1906242 RepID=UPI003D105362